MNVDIDLLGLQNDTIQSYADRLQMRLVDQPIFATHLRAMEIVGKDTIELVFDAIPEEYMEPLRQVIGPMEEMEFFAFPVASEPGQNATGVRIKPKNLREVKDQALVDIGVETPEKEEDTNEQGPVSGLSLVIKEPKAKDVVESLLDEMAPSAPSQGGRFFLIIEMLALGFGKVLSGQELVPQTFESATTAWGKFKEHVSGYHYAIEDIQPDLLTRPAGRQTVAVESGTTGERMGEVVFAWKPHGNGTTISARYRHFADGPSANPSQS